MLVGGEPLAGDVGLMSAVKPGDHEIVASPAGGFQKAIDAITTCPVPAAAQTIGQITTTLQTASSGLGGDNPPPGGGPGPPTNTYRYLRTHVDGGSLASLPDPVFYGLLASEVGTLPDGSINLERIRLNPLFDEDEELLADVLHGNVDPGTGLRPPTQTRPTSFTRPTSTRSAGSAIHSRTCPSRSTWTPVNPELQSSPWPTDHGGHELDMAVTEFVWHSANSLHCGRSILKQAGPSCVYRSHRSLRPGSRTGKSRPPAFSRCRRRSVSGDQERSPQDPRRGIHKGCCG